MSNNEDNVCIFMTKAQKDLYYKLVKSMDGNLKEISKEYHKIIKSSPPNSRYSHEYSPPKQPGHTSSQSSTKTTPPKPGWGSWGGPPSSSGGYRKTNKKINKLHKKKNKKYNYKLNKNK